MRLLAVITNTPYELMSDQQKRDDEPRPWDEWGPQEQEEAMIKWLGRPFFEIAAWLAWCEEATVFDKLYKEFIEDCEGAVFMFANDSLGYRKWQKQRIERLCVEYHKGASQPLHRTPDAPGKNGDVGRL